MNILLIARLADTFTNLMECPIHRTMKRLIPPKYTNNLIDNAREIRTQEQCTSLRSIVLQCVCA